MRNPGIAVMSVKRHVEAAELPQGLRQKTLQYWVLSSAWNRREPCASIFNMGTLISGLTDLGFSLYDSHKLQFRQASLLERVIAARRCRKSKDPKNLISLEEATVALKAKQAERVARRTHASKAHQPQLPSNEPQKQVG